MKSMNDTVNLNKLQNKYIGELHSTSDENNVTIILIEDGFSPLTSLLLSATSHYIIVIQQAKRCLSSNFETYLQVHISTSNIKIIGKFIPMLVENPFLDQDKEALKELKQFSMLT